MNYKTKAGNVKDIITIGDKYSIFEFDNFAKAAQPLYIMLDKNEKLLAFPVGKSDAKTYLAWLQCGVNAFEKK